MKTTLTTSQSIGYGDTANGSQTLTRTLFGKIRAALADRALRHQLAELDDALLRDIGVAEDEIWRVRSHHSFTPRAWR